MEDTTARSAHSALMYAIVGGSLGFVATAFVGHLTRDPFAFYARGLVTASLLGAGIGWLLGAGFGIVRTRGAPPTPLASWLLRAFGVAFLLAAFTAAWWTGFLPRTLGLGFHVTAREPMERVIWLDAGLAALTCVVLAQRSYRRPAILLGAIVGIALVTTAIAVVASGPCPLSQCDDLFAPR